MRIPRISVTERTPGKWSVRWREHGRQRELRSYPTEEAAKDAAFAIETRLRAGLPGTRNAITIRQLVAAWWDGYVVTLSAASIRNYATSTRRILDTIGSANAADLNIPTLVSWRNELEAYLHSPRLVNECLDRLSGAFKYGVEAGLAEANPMPSVPRLAEPASNIVVPTREEVARLGITAPTHVARVRAVISSYVGLRPGEQLALEWRHIHDNVIRVEQAMKIDGRIGPTKTGKPRVVPVPSSVLGVLHDWRSRTRFARPGDPVLPSPHGTRINPSRWRSEVWYEWRADAGVEHLHWRTLRHYYAAAVASAGGTMLQCSRWMGHASIKTTSDRYAYLFDEDATPVMERLG